MCGKPGNSNASPERLTSAMALNLVLPHLKLLLFMLILRILEMFLYSLLVYHTKIGTDFSHIETKIIICSNKVFYKV